MAKTAYGNFIKISSVSSKGAVTTVLDYSMGKAPVVIYTNWFAVEVAKIKAFLQTKMVVLTKGRSYY